MIIRFFGYPFFDDVTGSVALDLNKRFDGNQECGTVKTALANIRSKLNKEGMVPCI